jgi:hypothetical protein
VAAIDLVMQHYGLGLRMGPNAMSVIVFGEAVLECGSNTSQAQRELADQENWSRLCAAAERAYPGDPTRRLHSK